MIRKPDLRTEVDKAWRLATAPFRAMPSWVLAGAPKCGTSTLFDYLVDHPGCRRGAWKEPTSFLHFPGSRFRSAMNFPLRLGRRFSVGDASVEYFAHPDGARNVRDMIPDARVIFIFRDPIERAWSDFCMFQKSGQETGDFDMVIERAVSWIRDPGLAPLVDSAMRQAFNPVRYVVCGMYARCLERWLEVFSREQCLFLMSEEFFRDPLSIASLARRHVGLCDAPIRELPIARERMNATPMPASARAVLTEFFAPEDERLVSLLGRELPWRAGI